MPKITAIQSDGSCDHLILPDDMDIDAQKVVWRNWYRERYCPDLNAGKRPKYTSFVDFLKEQGAREPTDDELVHWEDF